MYGKRKMCTEFFWTNLKERDDGQVKESSRSGNGLQHPHRKISRRSSAARFDLSMFKKQPTKSHCFDNKRFVERRAV
jgi:hypothetical protein